MWQRSQKSSSEERKLELRLGPPGEESLNEKTMKNVKRETHESSLTLGSHHHQQANDKGSSFLQLSTRPVMGKDAGNNAFSSPSSSNSAAPNRSQKRSAPGPVVGWPPIRSSRKNLASGSSSKPPLGSQQHKVASSNQPIVNSGKGLFVKINMDGVPIGRKVDINAYDGYEELSSAVDKLFSSLLEELNLSHIVFSHGCSARRDSSASGIHNKHEEDKAITGLLIGSGEYTLIYEDNEGDKMLVGDVPWHMFVSTVKRLRVVKSSALPAFNRLDKITTSTEIRRTR